MARGAAFAGPLDRVDRATLEALTERARRISQNRAEFAAGADEVIASCEVHGATRFARRADGGGWRCLECRAEQVARRRGKVKAILVAEAGGACLLCGYDRSMAALQFHHLDPGRKEFHIAHRGVTRSIAAARAEASKCVPPCANCHAEVEAGVATLPARAPDQLPG